MKNGEKPILAILGGAKISSKIPIVNNIIDVVDHIIIGGGMAYFYKSSRWKNWLSICEDEMMPIALKILKTAKNKNVKIHLPSDVICSKEFSNESESKTFEISNIPNDFQGWMPAEKLLKISMKL